METREIKQRVREQYGRVGDAYVTSPTHRFGKDLGRLVEVAEPSADMRVLDIATGGGHTAIALAPLVGDVVMLDLTPQMLVHASAFAEESGVDPLGVIAAAAEDLPFTDGSFDLVSCRIAPHHFADVRSFVREVARVLRPSGTFVLIDSVSPEDPALDEFINTLEQRRDPSHVRAYTLTEWNEFLRRAGLEIDLTEQILKRHEYASWTARSQMTDAERDALADWVLSADPQTKSHFGVEEEDGRFISFADFKLLLRARKRG